MRRKKKVIYLFKRDVLSVNQSSSILEQATANFLKQQRIASFRGECNFGGPLAHLTLGCTEGPAPPVNGHQSIEDSSEEDTEMKILSPEKLYGAMYATGKLNVILLPARLR